MMNLNGKRGGKHAAGSKQAQQRNRNRTEEGRAGRRAESPVNDYASSEQTRVYNRDAISSAANKAEKKKKRIWLRVLIGILVFVLAVGATLAALYFIYVKPPEVSDQLDDGKQVQQDDTQPDDTPDDVQDDAEPTGRKDGVYTFADVYKRQSVRGFLF